jgi:hypothetical protein
MRAVGLLALVAIASACQRQAEVHGLYLNDGKSGYLFACGQQRNPLLVPDSALAATYRLKATSPGQPMFVRLRGVLADSGSVYGGVRYLLAPKPLEIRAPKPGDCPSATRPILPATPHQRT